MFSDGYEVICSWVGNLKSVFGLSSAEEDDVKQFCDHQLSEDDLRANALIFPQLRGLGRSPMARNYGIDSLAEARAYLSHVVLGPRLKQCVEAVLEVYPTSRLTIRDRGYWLKRTVTRLRDRHDPVVRPSLFQVSASSEVLGGVGRRSRSPSSGRQQHMETWGKV